MTITITTIINGKNKQKINTFLSSKKKGIDAVNIENRVYLWIQDNSNILTIELDVIINIEIIIKCMECAEIKLHR